MAALLRELSEGADSLFVGGFSMGGALALHLLRGTLPANLYGVFSIGSFLTADSALLTGELPIAAAGPPVLMMHGSEDLLVPLAWGRATSTSLLLGGADVQFREYAGLSHEIGEEQLADLLLWMEDALHRRTIETSTPGRGLFGGSLAEFRDAEDCFPFLIESEPGSSSVRVRFMVPAGA